LFSEIRRSSIRRGNSAAIYIIFGMLYESTIHPITRKIGFAHGVADVVRGLMAASANKQKEWGLVPVSGRKQAGDWFLQNYKRAMIRRRSQAGYSDAGYGAGRNVSLNKGVPTQSAQRLSSANEQHSKSRASDETRRSTRQHFRRCGLGKRLLFYQIFFGAGDRGILHDTSIV
jgi:hypothetical protein